MFEPNPSLIEDARRRPWYRLGNARLRAGWAEACAQGDWAMLALIDIDAFKTLNDTAGHPEGDSCLQAVARALASTAAVHGGEVARYGGEEFIVYLSGAEPGRAESVGESLRAAVAHLAYPHPGLPDDGAVTVSVGIAAAHCSLGAVGTGADDLLKAADDALYRAKRAGRNRVQSTVLTPAPANCDRAPSAAIG